jgi:hypothetical protein
VLLRYEVIQRLDEGYTGLSHIVKKKSLLIRLKSGVADLEDPKIRCLFNPWIRDNHLFESLESIFGVEKYLKSLIQIRIRDPRSGIRNLFNRYGKSNDK